MYTYRATIYDRASVTEFIVVYKSMKRKGSGENTRDMIANMGSTIPGKKAIAFHHPLEVVDVTLLSKDNSTRA